MARIFAGRQAAWANEQNLIASAAYLTALLARQKRMPPLRKFLMRTKSKPQTWQQQLANVKGWAAVMGIKVIKKPADPARGD